MAIKPGGEHCPNCQVASYFSFRWLIEGLDIVYGGDAKKYPKLSPKLAGLFFSASFSASSAKVSLLFPRVVVSLEMMSAFDWESTSK